MENMKIPIALVAAMAMQLAGGVWWVSQQASTIANLEEVVSELGSKMAIEDNVNLKRDVQDNAMEIDYLWDEADEIWEEHKQLASTIKAITVLQQRVAVLENELKYLFRDHDEIRGHPMQGSMK